MVNNTERTSNRVDLIWRSDCGKNARIQRRPSFCDRRLISVTPSVELIKEVGD